jgi:SAM-dependent methyltransferase
VLGLEKPNQWTRILDLGLPAALTVLALGLLAKRWYMDDLDLNVAFTGIGPGVAAGAVFLLVVIGTLYTLTAPARDERLNRALDFVAAVALGILTAGIILQAGNRSEHLAWLAERLNIEPARFAQIVTYGLPAVFCYIFVERPIRFGLCVGAFVLASAICAHQQDPALFRDRSFFGVLEVKADAAGGHRLVHGTTLHGRQRYLPNEGLFVTYLTPLAAGTPLEVAALTAAADSFGSEILDLRRTPLTYYHRDGPIGQVFAEFDRQKRRPPLAFIGLGTGTLASYGEPGQHVDYYEIDTHVIDIATNPRYFTYVTDARHRGVRLDIKLGDARLKIAEAPDHLYGLIAVDAFSSDAIPVHLITKEAVETFLKKLAPDGILAYHISNRHLDLEPVLGNIARDLGLVSINQSDPEARPSVEVRDDKWFVVDRGTDEEFGPYSSREEAVRVFQGRQEEMDGKLGSHWVLLARRHADFGNLPDLMRAGGRRWRTTATNPKVGIWTDDYSNLLSVLTW